MVDRIKMQKEEKIDSWHICMYKIMIAISAVFIGLYCINNNLNLENIPIGNGLIQVNNMLSIIAAGCCGIYYYTYKKKSLLVILIIYISLSVESLLGTYLIRIGNQQFILSQFSLVLAHIFRTVLLTGALIEDGKILNWITNKVVKSIIYTIIFTIGITLFELYLYHRFDHVFSQKVLLIINYILIGYLYVMVISLKNKSLKDKKGIYIIISASISMFALKRLYSIPAIIYNENKYSDLIRVFLMFGYLIVIIGLFVETIKSINDAEALREELKLFYNITHYNKVNSVLIFDENENVIYTNEIFEEKYRKEFDLSQKNGHELNKAKSNCIPYEKSIEMVKLVNEKGKFSGIVEQVDGGKIYHDIQSVVTEKNEIVTMVSFRDVTEEEEMKLEYYRIKEQEIIRTEFFANISHELRTPINIIYSSFQLLNQGREKGCDEFKGYYDKYRGTIKHNCFRMLRLINNLIDMTRLEVDNVVTRIENIEVISFIENITLSVIPYVEAKKINIIFDTQVEDQIIKCDKEKIERVMLNLLSNSIKFTDIGGNILVDIEVDEKWVMVKVKDDGVGIPENMKDYVFERFAQTNKSLNREKEGSGIGLALVKSIIELHNGEVYLNNSSKVGCEIIFKLPNEKLEGNIDYKGIKEDDRPIKEKISLELSDIYDIV